MFVKVDNNSGDIDIFNPKEMALIKYTDFLITKTYSAHFEAATLGFAFMPNAVRKIRYDCTVE